MNGIKIQIEIFEHILHTQMSYRDVCLILHCIDGGNLTTYSNNLFWVSVLKKKVDYNSVPY
jgi:hypothetical protein